MDSLKPFIKSVPGTVKEKILAAALACIEKRGLHSVTVRTIAEEAGVNIAAINYYFTSKENLILHALKQSVNEGFVKVIPEVKALNLGPEDSLKALIKGLLAGGFTYPGIGSAQLQEFKDNKEYADYFQQIFKGFLDNFSEILKEILIDTEEADLRLITVQMVSSFIFPGIYSDMFCEFIPGDMKSEEFIDSYAESLICLIKK